MNDFASLITIFTVVSLLLTFFDRAHGSPNFDYNRASKNAATLETQIELSILLKNLATPAKLNIPTCVTYTKLKGHEKWVEYHRTERVSGTKDAAFTSKVRIPYLLKDELELKFEIHHKSDSSVTHVFGGSAQCELAALLNTGKIEMTLKLKPDDENHTGGSVGYIIVYAEKFDNYKDLVFMEVRGDDLRKKHTFRSAKHFIEIYKRVTGDGEGESTNSEDDYRIAYRSEVMDVFLGQWEKIILPYNTLCNGERFRELKFVCWDGNKVVGEFRSTVEKIDTRRLDEKFFLIDQVSSIVIVFTQRKKTTGEITIPNFGVVSTPSFSDLIASGLQIEMTIAIDFSMMNNGAPGSVGSFHQRGAGENKYEKALRLIVGAFQDYVPSNQYDVRGFGARGEDGMDLDDFELLSNPSGGAKGINNVLDVYRNAFTKIKMGSKPNTAPTISRLAEVARHYKRSTTKKYHVLVVLMAGDIMFDLSTASAMREGLLEPLSIIFVGIDGTNFTEVKNVYETVLDLRRQYRSTLHFVSLEEFELYDSSRRYHEVELLAKLPEQILLYMHSLNVKPY